MRRVAGLAILLLSILPLWTAAPGRAGAQDNAAYNCTPVPDLIFNGATPRLFLVGPGVERVHFVKDRAEAPGCPNATAACAGRGFVVPGDAVVVTGTRDDYACATFTGPPPKASSSTGWLPVRALIAPPPPPPGNIDWTGDWRCGAEQHIRVRRAPKGGIALDGDATWGALDPDRVRRGGVNTGDFAATVAEPGEHVAFLIGDGDKVLPYDAKRGDAEVLCGLRLWRLGPYLVAADNLHCGGNNVTFTGIYRRAGGPA